MRTLKITCLFILGLSSAVTFAKDVTLRWKLIDYAAAYNLEVASEETFQRPILKKRVSENSHQAELSPGSYFLRVQVVNTAGFAGQWSRPFRLVVTPDDYRSSSEGSVEIANKLDSPKEVPRFYAGLGPAISTALIGIGGTKLNLHLGMLFPHAEKIDFKIFYDLSLNTSNAGGSPSATLGGAGRFFLKERSEDMSPEGELLFGYGGSNRYTDSSVVVGVGVGMHFFRTKPTSFDLILSRIVTVTVATNNLGAFPTVDTLRVGVQW